MKKALSLLLSIVMLVSVFAIGNTSVYAATNIKSNKDYTITFNSRVNKRTLVYTVPNGGGYYYFRVTAISNGLASFEAKANNKKIPTTITDIGNGVNTAGAYTYAKGTKIKLVLDEDYGFTDDGEYTEYKVRVVYKKSKDFERENNNSKKKANAFNLKARKTGYVFDGDQDYWVFKAPKKGKYRFYVVDASEDGAVEADAYVGNKRVGYTMAYDGEGSVSLGTTKLKKGTKVYIRVKNYSATFLYGPQRYKVFAKKIK